MLLAPLLLLDIVGGDVRLKLLACLSVEEASRSSCAVESADVLTVFTERSRGDSLFLIPLVCGGGGAGKGVPGTAGTIGAEEF